MTDFSGNNPMHDEDSVSPGRRRHHHRGHCWIITCCGILVLALAAAALVFFILPPRKPTSSSSSSSPAVVVTLCGMGIGGVSEEEYHDGFGAALESKIATSLNANRAKSKLASDGGSSYCDNRRRLLRVRMLSGEADVVVDVEVEYDDSDTDADTAGSDADDYVASGLDDDVDDAAADSGISPASVDVVDAPSTVVEDNTSSNDDDDDGDDDGSGDDDDGGGDDDGSGGASSPSPSSPSPSPSPSATPSVTPSITPTALPEFPFKSPPVKVRDFDKEGDSDPRANLVWGDVLYGSVQVERSTSTHSHFFSMPLNRSSIQYYENSLGYGSPSSFPSTYIVDSNGALIISMSGDLFRAVTPGAPFEKWYDYKINTDTDIAVDGKLIQCGQRWFGTGSKGQTGNEVVEIFPNATMKWFGDLRPGSSGSSPTFGKLPSADGDSENRMWVSFTVESSVVELHEIDCNAPGQDLVQVSIAEELTLAGSTLYIASTTQAWVRAKNSESSSPTSTYYVAIDLTTGEETYTAEVTSTRYRTVASNGDPYLFSTNDLIILHHEEADVSTLNYDTDLGIDGTLLTVASHGDYVYFVERDGSSGNYQFIISRVDIGSRSLDSSDSWDSVSATYTFYFPTFVLLPGQSLPDVPRIFADHDADEGLGSELYEIPLRDAESGVIPSPELVKDISKSEHSLIESFCNLNNSIAFVAVRTVYVYFPETDELLRVNDAERGPNVPEGDLSASTLTSDGEDKLYWADTSNQVLLEYSLSENKTELASSDARGYRDIVVRGDYVAYETDSDNELAVFNRVSRTVKKYTLGDAVAPNAYLMRPFNETSVIYYAKVTSSRFNLVWVDVTNGAWVDTINYCSFEYCEDLPNDSQNWPIAFDDKIFTVTDRFGRERLQIIDINAGTMTEPEWGSGEGSSNDWSPNAFLISEDETKMFWIMSRPPRNLIYYDKATQKMWTHDSTVSLTDQGEFVQFGSFLIGNEGNQRRGSLNWYRWDRDAETGKTERIPGAFYLTDGGSEMIKYDDKTLFYVTENGRSGRSLFKLVAE